MGHRRLRFLGGCVDEFSEHKRDPTGWAIHVGPIHGVRFECDRAGEWHRQLHIAAGFEHPVDVDNRRLDADGDDDVSGAPRPGSWYWRRADGFSDLDESWHCVVAGGAGLFDAGGKPAAQSATLIEHSAIRRQHRIADGARLPATARCGQPNLGASLDCRHFTALGRSAHPSTH